MCVWCVCLECLDDEDEDEDEDEKRGKCAGLYTFPKHAWLLSRQGGVGPNMFTLVRVVPCILEERASLWAATRVELDLELGRS